MSETKTVEDFKLRANPTSEDTTTEDMEQRLKRKSSEDNILANYQRDNNLKDIRQQIQR